MVFDSATGTGKVMVTELASTNGKPVIAIIHSKKNHGGMIVNDIASVHEKTDAESAMKAWIGNGLLRYIRNENDLSGNATRHPLPASIALLAKGHAKSILTEADVVNQFGTGFSRGIGRGMALRDLNAVVERVAKGFRNLPKVHVFSSPSDLSVKDPVQKALRDFIKKSDAWEDVEGATHEGEIYLFASGMADEARAEHVLATHEITHYGLRGAIGKELDAALQHVLLMNAKVRKAAAEMKRRRRAIWTQTSRRLRKCLPTCQRLIW